MNGLTYIDIEGEMNSVLKLWLELFLEGEKDLKQGL